MPAQLLSASARRSSSERPHGRAGACVQSPGVFAKIQLGCSPQSSKEDEFAQGSLMAISTSAAASLDTIAMCARQRHHARTTRATHLSVINIKVFSPVRLPGSTAALPAGRLCLPLRMYVCVENAKHILLILLVPLRWCVVCTQSFPRFKHGWLEGERNAFNARFHLGQKY